MKNVTQLGAVELVLKGQNLLLLPQRMIWWKAYKTLILSDWHVGKAAHFRKAGIPISKKVHQAELEKLAHTTRLFPVERLLVLGDLYHSLPNNETFEFNQWINRFDFEVTLVLGNHDLQSATHSASSSIVCRNTLVEPPFIFTHEPLEVPDTALYNLCGHIHPVVRLVGKGRQSMRLPCFYFGEKRGILPAFGNFNGGYTLKGNAHTKIFPITKQTVLKIN